MFVLLLALLIFFYLFFRVVLPLPVSKRCKTAAGVLLFVFTQQHLFYRYLLGSLASPELPFPLLLFATGSFIFLLFLFLLTLGRDAALGLRRLTSRRVGGAKSETGAFSPGRRQALMACLAAVPAVYGVRNALTVPGVHSLEARFPALPKAFDGFRIAHISDLHISSLLHAPRVRAIVDRINALKPDMIVFTGDMVDGFPRRRAEGVAPLRDLRAAHGVFACAGNHEYYADFRAWMRVFQDIGMEMLLNGHRQIAVGGAKLTLAGVTDMVASRYDLPVPSVEAALKGAPEGAFTVLLDHRPINAEKNAAAGAHLQLSGHTHGGQILGMTRLVAAYNDGYLYGWYQIAGMKLYVSSGAGLWGGFPVRLGVPSEIVDLTLRSA